MSVSYEQLNRECNAYIRSKEALKFKVKQLTCHVNRDRIQFEKMLNSYKEDEVRTLCRVLYLELLNVISAVEEAK